MKKIRAGEPVYWPLGAGAGATRKTIQEPEPLGKKIRSRSRLKIKSGAGAAKKFAGSPALKKYIHREITFSKNFSIIKKKEEEENM